MWGQSYAIRVLNGNVVPYKLTVQEENEKRDQRLRFDWLLGVIHVIIPRLLSQTLSSDQNKSPDPFVNTVLV